VGVISREIGPDNRTSIKIYRNLEFQFERKRNEIKNRDNSDSFHRAADREHERNEAELRK